MARQGRGKIALVMQGEAGQGLMEKEGHEQD